MKFGFGFGFESGFESGFGLELLLWLFIFYKKSKTIDRFMPLIIFSNSLSYNIYPNNAFLHIIDKLSNGGFIFYLNTTKKNQPDIFFYTMIIYLLSCIMNTKLSRLILILQSCDYLNYEYDLICNIYKMNLFIYDVLDKHAEVVFKIEYNEIDNLFSNISSTERVGEVDDFSQHQGNNKEPNIIQDVTTEFNTPPNDLTVRGDDHELGHN